MTACPSGQKLDNLRRMYKYSNLKKYTISSAQVFLSKVRRIPQDYSIIIKTFLACER